MLDLNDTYPKDEFPLLVTELMIDAIIGRETLSFMDCTVGYEQIQMALADQNATAFLTSKGSFCYKFDAFWLEDVGVTYQREMQKIFKDILHKMIECYMDDLVVISKKILDHLHDLPNIQKIVKVPTKGESLKMYIWCHIW